MKRPGERFVELVKQTYRVLLTCGMKECYVYFMDDSTCKFFQTLIDRERIHIGRSSRSAGEALPPDNSTRGTRGS